MNIENNYGSENLIQKNNLNGGSSEEDKLSVSNSDSIENELNMSDQFPANQN